MCFLPGTPLRIWMSLNVECNNVCTFARDKDRIRENILTNRQTEKASKQDEANRQSVQPAKQDEGKEGCSPSREGKGRFINWC